MSERPPTTPGGDPDPQHPDQGRPVEAPAPADQAATAALPPQHDPAETAAFPSQRPAATDPPSAPPPAGWQPPPAASDASAAAPAAGAGAADGVRRAWGEATSSRGGRVALVVSAVLGTLLLVTGIGLVAALAGDDDGRDAVGWSDGRGPGMGHGQGKGPGNRDGKDRGDGHGMGDRDRDGDEDDDGEKQGQGNGNGWGQGGQPGGNGPGMGRGGGLDAMDDLLHGEFTTGITGTPTVMVFQTGVITAYTEGSSITLRSTDGFEATYSLEGGFATTRSAIPLATGTRVSLVAAKEGLKVTRLVPRP